MMKMVWKTVPCSRSSTREAVLFELGSAPRLDVDSCVGGSETRSTGGARDCGMSYVWNALNIHHGHQKQNLTNI